MQKCREDTFQDSRQRRRENEARRLGVPSPVALGEVEEARRELMDAVTKAVLEVLGGAGYTVTIGVADGATMVEAIDSKTSEVFVVRGDDLYRAVVELAAQYGIDVMDG